MACRSFNMISVMTRGSQSYGYRTLALMPYQEQIMSKKMLKLCRWRAPSRSIAAQVPIAIRYFLGLSTSGLQKAQVSQDSVVFVTDVFSGESLPNNEAVLESWRSIYTGSALCWQQIEQWLTVCTETHHKCSKNHLPPYYPTRLLDVGSKSSQVKVHLSQEKHTSGPYITLSHCWGAVKVVKLLAENISEFLQGIAVRI